MFSRVRTAVLSFILAFVCASAFASLFPDKGRKPGRAYNPSTGQVVRVEEIRPDGSLLLWSSEMNENFEGKASEWVLSKTNQNPWMYHDHALKSMTVGYLSAEFEDGKLYFELPYADGGVIADPSEVVPLKRAPRIANHLGILENGQKVAILGLLEDGRLWVTTPGKKSGGYFRERAGVVVLPTESEVLDNALELLQQLSSLFEGFDVRGLDLNDPIQAQLFRIYVVTRFLGASSDFISLDRRLDSLHNFVNANRIPEKLELNTVEILTDSRVLRLRRLEALESVFRGCLGQDCSTNTRFFRSLEPAHLNFAIEEVPYRGIGQVEVVLGKSEDRAGRRLAFLERVQSPKNLRVHELANILTALYVELAKQGYALVMPETLSHYRDGRHPISNNSSIERRLQEAIEQHFELGTKHTRFIRHKDVLPNGDAQFMNLVAHALGELGRPVFELVPKPETKLAYEQHARIARAADITPAPTLYAPLLAKVKREIERIARSQKSRELFVTPEVWRDVKAQLYASPCESRVAGASPKIRSTSIP